MVASASYGLGPSLGFRVAFARIWSPFLVLCFGDLASSWDRAKNSFVQVFPKVADTATVQHKKVGSVHDVGLVDQDSPKP